MGLVPCEHPKRLMHIDQHIREIIEAIAPRFVQGTIFTFDGKLFSIGMWCPHGLLEVEVHNASTLHPIVTIEYHQDGRRPQAFHS